MNHTQNTPAPKPEEKKQPKVQKPSSALSVKTGVKAGLDWAGQ